MRHRGACDLPSPLGPVREDFVIPDEERIIKEVLTLIEQRGMGNVFFWDNSLNSDEGSDYR